MTMFNVNGISVTQVLEQRGLGYLPDFLYPEWDADVLRTHHALMVPECFDVGTRRFISSIHTWVVRTKHHTILVDTCVGNHKNRSLDRFNQLDLPYLARLNDAGVTPESVDYVMCTHLHADHCGWNTRMLNGRWVPTFPNAKYVFSRAELDYWESQIGTEGFNANVFEDSVLPVIEHGQALVVEGVEALGDSFLIHRTGGHSPGHVTFELLNKGRSLGSGLFSGDTMHQPLQVFKPEWNSCFCSDPQQAIASRRWLLEHAAEHSSTVFTAHFANSSAGLVTRNGDSFDWQFIQPGERA